MRDGRAYGYCKFEEGDDDIDPDVEADALVGVSEEDREAIRQGLRDGKEGRVKTADEVFEPLLARLRAMTADRALGNAR